RTWGAAPADRRATALRRTRRRATTRTLRGASSSAWRAPCPGTACCPGSRSARSPRAGPPPRRRSRGRSRNRRRTRAARARARGSTPRPCRASRCGPARAPPARDRSGGPGSPAPGRGAGRGRRSTTGGRKRAAGGSRLRAGEGAEGEALLVRRHVYLDLVAARELADQDLLRERVLDVLLDRPLQRPGAEVLVVPV